MAFRINRIHLKASDSTHLEIDITRLEGLGARLLLRRS
jgi:hypothetical protein